MSQMRMTFFTSTTTPLYSIAWTPTSTGLYAATCIFLICFAVVFRGLLALRAGLERRWRSVEGERKGRLVIRRPSSSYEEGEEVVSSGGGGGDGDDESERSGSVVGGPPTVKRHEREMMRRRGDVDVDEKADMREMIQTQTQTQTESSAAAASSPSPSTSSIPPWRISQDGIRASVDVAIAGVGYLL